VQVRARAFAPDLFPCPPGSETCLRLDDNLLQRTSDVPFIVVHTLGGGAIAQSAFKNAHVSIYETKHGRASLASEPSVTTRHQPLLSRGSAGAALAIFRWNTPFEAQPRGQPALASFGRFQLLELHRMKTIALIGAGGKWAAG
jgi:hypothetical protein